VSEYGDEFCRWWSDAVERRRRLFLYGSILRLESGPYAWQQRLLEHADLEQLELGLLRDNPQLRELLPPEQRGAVLRKLGLEEQHGAPPDEKDFGRQELAVMYDYLRELGDLGPAHDERRQRLRREIQDAHPGPFPSLDDDLLVHDRFISESEARDRYERVLSQGWRFLPDESAYHVRLRKARQDDLTVARRNRNQLAIAREGSEGVDFPESPTGSSAAETRSASPDGMSLWNLAWWPPLMAAAMDEMTKRHDHGPAGLHRALVRLKNPHAEDSRNTRHRWLRVWGDGSEAQREAAQNAWQRRHSLPPS
jgi:hypothetical protein